MESPNSMGNRIALVTGATRGIGHAIASGLASHDVCPIVTGRDEALGQKVASELEGVFRKLDVTVRQDVEDIARWLEREHGGLDVLVNNASSLGPVPLALLADTECEELEAAFATNLVGPFRLTKALLGALAASARAGRPALVINIISDAAVTAYAGWGAYGASKAALLHLSRIWNEELAGHGIRVEPIDPGDMDTPLHALAVPDADPATLKRPADSAREIVDFIEAHTRESRSRG